MKSLVNRNAASMRRCDGDATEVRRRCGGAAEARRRCDGSATEMRRSGGGATEVRRKCDGDAAERAEARQRCDGSATETKRSTKPHQHENTTKAQHTSSAGKLAKCRHTQRLPFSITQDHVMDQLRKLQKCMHPNTNHRSLFHLFTDRVHPQNRCSSHSKSVKI